MRKRLLVAVTGLSIAALAVAPLTYAREAQPGDDRVRGGRQEVQVNDDQGPHADRAIEVQLGDDRGVDAAQAADDNRVDPRPDF